eukprot:4378882-Alexandrium_andersonii.AAC.1
MPNEPQGRANARLGADARLPRPHPPPPCPATGMARLGRGMAWGMGAAATAGSPFSLPNPCPAALADQRSRCPSRPGKPTPSATSLLMRIGACMRADAACRT